MCVLLGDFLRSTLNVSRHESIRLADELCTGRPLPRHPSKCASARDCRHTATYRPGCARLPSAAVDAFTQPLVENAVVHGVASRRTVGTIEIDVTRSGDSVSLVVDNTRRRCIRRPYFNARSVGLDNVRSNT